MTLSELLADSRVLALHGPDPEVLGLAYDSRRVRPGDVFFALGGVKADGATFVARAIESGAAAAVMGPGSVPPSGTWAEVEEPRRAMAEASGRWYRHPSRELTVAAVTGTNGKTTTTWMLESIFRAAGWKSGVIGTTGIRIGDEARTSAFTTPESPELQGLLREMADRGTRAVAMEVSSHALVQRRSYGLECDVAIFTNLTQDHLDYHGTMESYLDAKLMLFDGRNGSVGKRGVAVVNANDPAASRVAAAARRGGLRVLEFGIETEGDGTVDLDLKVKGVDARPHGLDLQVFFDPRPRPGPVPGMRVVESEFHVRLPLLGRFNAANAAAATTAAFALGIDRETVVRGLESMPGVPGRLERVEARQPFEVVVDYAHTPDALERALAAAREHTGARVLLVFGCGGDRDRAKRSPMGAIAARADLVWVTNDNPRGEDPAAIAAEILTGAPHGALRVELDRRAAIGAAIAAARPGDLVLIAGKGHETTQTVGAEVLPFDDRAVARAALEGARG